MPTDFLIFLLKEKGGTHGARSEKHADWEIAQDAETGMKTVQQLGRDMGLLDKELLPYGHVMGKVDYRAVLERLGDKPNGQIY